MKDLEKRLSIIEDKLGIVKDELVVGKWYKTDKTLFNHQEYYNSYGFFNNEWVIGWKTGVKDFYGVTPIEASRQEVEEALLREARRRYRVGYTVRCLDGINDVVRGTDIAFANYKLFTNGEKVDDGEWFNTSGCLFDNGKWAEIIEQPVDKFDELKEAYKNGAVIQINSIYNGWHDVEDESDLWLPTYEYRIKPTQQSSLEQDIQQLKDKYKQYKFTITIEDNI